MAQSQTLDESFGQDPILAYRPSFAQSLPVQILLSGVALTLALVLLLHLVFTAPYHFPLARTNYILQLIGVTTLLVSLVATIYVVLASTLQQSQHWPYMLSYLAVDIPATRYWQNSTDPLLEYHSMWSPAQSATWAVMNTTTSIVVQITHIHFLTLLFPSYLEARLIFCLLGPLAIISAVMQLLPTMRGADVAAIAEDSRNVCNAALSLLFTSFLVIWGCFVNRRQAWRTDGGTAAFGAGAIFLAIASTTLNFVYIPRQDQYGWMPKLMWAVTLWQSFLGWWWWVGAGMGVREVEELLLRENKRQQKRLLRAQRRKEHREKARSVWKGVTGAFKPPYSTHSGSDAHGPDRPLSRPPSSCDETVASFASVAGSVIATPSPWMFPVHVVQRWFARLRHAHLTAAHIQAAERAERLQQVYHRDEDRRIVGLGGIGLLAAERERRDGMEMQMHERISPKQVEDDGDEDAWKDVPMTEDIDPQLRHRSRDGNPHVSDDDGDEDEDEDSRGSSMWWWGPLRRWRLQDSTKYR